eukprot:Amastigsp_a174380_19.p1 type:complete len:254 gc:universal Amastigsp_a174380_19:2950-3711(+)
MVKYKPKAIQSTLIIPKLTKPSWPDPGWSGSTQMGSGSSSSRGAHQGVQAQAQVEDGVQQPVRAQVQGQVQAGVHQLVRVQMQAGVRQLVRVQVQVHRLELEPSIHECPGFEFKKYESKFQVQIVQEQQNQAKLCIGNPSVELWSGSLCIRASASQPALPAPRRSRRIAALFRIGPARLLGVNNHGVPYGGPSLMSVFWYLEFRCAATDAKTLAAAANLCTQLQVTARSGETTAAERTMLPTLLKNHQAAART